MSLLKYRREIGAGAFVQRTGTGFSNSLGALDVASAATFNNDIVGNARIRGIATVLSGTTVVSVAATGIASGDAILTTIYMYGDARTFNASRFFSTGVMSVRAGAFEIITIGSVAPTQDMPVSWWRID